jgi:two-component system nitrogen regulation response regulator GlnG
MGALARHSWPGNVRELENVIYRSAVIAQGDAILVKDLPAELRGTMPPGNEAPAARADEISQAESVASDSTANAAPIAQAATSPGLVDAPEPGEPVLTLERAIDFAFDALSASGEPLLPRIESEFVARAMKADDNDLTKASKRLGLPKAALQKRMKEA